MTEPVGVLVGALLLDAIDTNLPLDERQAAATRAVEVSPAFAVAFLVEVIGEAHEALAIATGLPPGQITGPGETRETILATGSRSSLAHLLQWPNKHRDR